MTIEGVRAPPPEVLNQMQHPAIQPIPTSLQQQVQPAQRLPIPHNIQVKVNTLTKTSILKNHFICVWLGFKDPYLYYNTDHYYYYYYYYYYLFNNALNTFYLRLYGVRHMVKDHSDSERGNPLPPHGLLFLISSKGSFICIIPYHGLCYSSRGALAGTRNSLFLYYNLLIFFLQTKVGVQSLPSSPHIQIRPGSKSVSVHSSPQAVQPLQRNKQNLAGSIPSTINALQGHVASVKVEGSPVSAHKRKFESLK